VRESATNHPNGRHISRDKFITCFSERRKEYESFKFTIGLSGFGWNEEDKLITASDEKWEELKNAHPTKQHYLWQKKPYHYRRLDGNLRRHSYYTRESKYSPRWFINIIVPHFNDIAQR
jgi:hypothetical protein